MIILLAISCYHYCYCLLLCYVTFFFKTKAIKMHKIIANTVKNTKKNACLFSTNVDIIVINI